jgi:hypothetical protein
MLTTKKITHIADATASEAYAEPMGVPLPFASVDKGTVKTDQAVPKSEWLTCIRWTV